MYVHVEKEHMLGWDHEHLKQKHGWIFFFFLLALCSRPAEESDFYHLGDWRFPGLNRNQISDVSFFLDNH